WLVNVDGVVHAPIARADVRDPHADVLELTLDREVELMDLSVAGAGGVSGNALRRDLSRSRWKRVRERKQRLPVLNRVEEALAELKGAVLEHSGEASECLGKNPIAAAKHGLFAVRPPGCSQPRGEVVQRGRFLCVSGHH